MSRSNYDKPFYVDVGTSIVAIRCASNNDVIVRYDHVVHPHAIELIEKICDRMNKEVEIGRPLRNFDRFDTLEQSQDAYHDECCEFVHWHDREDGAYIRKNGEPNFDDWLFKEANEGGAK